MNKKKRKQPEYELQKACVAWLRNTHPNLLTVHADATGGGPWKGNI